MNRLGGLIGRGTACGGAAALVCGFYPAAANAQYVRGHGEVLLDGPDFSPCQISVNAWLDAAGVAHDRIAWVGDIFDPVPSDLGAVRSSSSKTGAKFPVRPILGRVRKLHAPVGHTAVRSCHSVKRGGRIDGGILSSGDAGRLAVAVFCFSPDWHG